MTDQSDPQRYLFDPEHFSPEKLYRELHDSGTKAAEARATTHLLKLTEERVLTEVTLGLVQDSRAHVKAWKQRKRAGLPLEGDEDEDPKVLSLAEAQRRAILDPRVRAAHEDVAKANRIAELWKVRYETSRILVDMLRTKAANERHIDR